MPGLLTITPRQTRAFTGDDWWMSFTLYEDGTAANLTGATITVGVQNESRVQSITPQAQSAAASGANWGSGIVVVSIPYAQTQQLFDGRFYLEIQTYLNSRYKTWPLVPVDVKQYSVTSTH